MDPKKRLKEVSELQEVTEKSYEQKKNFSFFDHNFFQRRPRGLKPVINAFLGLFYPRKCIEMHGKSLEKILKLEIFYVENHWKVFTFFDQKVKELGTFLGSKNFKFQNFS